MKGPTQKEVIAVLRATNSKRNRSMIVLAYRHGMRTSEVCRLKLEDVDMKKITIGRLKGSLKTTQPLCDQQGNHCSQKRGWCEHGSRSAAIIPANTSSPARKAGA